MAAPTVMAAAQLGEETLAPRTAAAAPVGASGTVPSNPQPADVYDLEDALTDAAMPTSHLIAVQVNRDGTASFAMPRCEVGQGITTAIAMLIAEEMDLPVEKVHVGLSDARPELVFNQLTGGSNTLNSMYHPVRIAAAIAKGRLLDAAAEELDRGKEQLTSRAGVISVPGGRSLSYGELATKAASSTTKPVEAPPLKPDSEFKIIGKSQRRVDALDIVTGRKQFTTDLQIPDAKPTMVCRPPTINGTVKAVHNADEVRKMPGITDVAPVSTGVAVRGETFGQCIDAVNALKVTWGPGTKDAESDETVLQELKSATPPVALQPVPGTKVLDADFAFAFQGNSALEPRSAVADVKKDHAEIWAKLKIPIVAQDQIAKQIKMPHEAITVHVVTGGGSFGSSLFPDHAVEAAEISKKMGKPVKLMWHRADDVRQGRVHPMSYAKIRAVYGPQGVLGFEQHHASVRTDFSHGFGEAVSSSLTRTPLAGLGVSEAIFETTTISPYNFGAQKSLLTETHQSTADNQWHGGFNTSSMRNVYSPDVTTARELFVDLLAHAMGEDPLEFRLKFVKDDKYRTVLEKVAKEGNWGRPLPRGFAQGIGLHHEYKQVTAAFVELDCRPETVNRKMFMAATGPRVTRAIFATIPGKVVVNPLGMEAQLQGGFHDGIALALTSSLHLKNGHYVEASWDNYAYTREWNAPTQGVEVHILPPDPDDKVAGSGEAGVAASKAATACAYQRAMGKQQPQPVRGPADMWPVNHKGPMHFEEYPTVPPLPPPPTDGLKHTY